MSVEVSPALASRLLSIADVADFCAVSPRTVRRWIGSGALPACRLGRQVRVQEHELAALIQRNMIDEQGR